MDAWTDILKHKQKNVIKMFLMLIQISVFFLNSANLLLQYAYT